MDDPEINVRNLQRRTRIDHSALPGFVRRALTLCFRSNPDRGTPLRSLKEISVILISDRRMAVLHRKFLHQSGPTDVITFEHGEIFISVETAQRHARRFQSSTLREIQLYIVHGLLHLHGFDDDSAANARRMQNMQEKILRQIK